MSLLPAPAAAGAVAAQFEAEAVARSIHPVVAAAQRIVLASQQLLRFVLGFHSVFRCQRCLMLHSVLRFRPSWEVVASQTADRSRRSVFLAAVVIREMRVWWMWKLCCSAC